MESKRRPSSRPVIVEEHRKGEGRPLLHSRAAQGDRRHELLSGEMHAPGKGVVNSRDEPAEESVNHESHDESLGRFHEEKTRRNRDTGVDCPDISYRDVSIDQNLLFYTSDSDVISENLNEEEQFETHIIHEIFPLVEMEDVRVNNGKTHCDKPATSVARCKPRSKGSGGGATSAQARSLANSARTPPPPPPPKGRKTDAAAPIGSRRLNGELMAKAIADGEEERERDAMASECQPLLHPRERVEEEGNEKPPPTQKSEIQELTIENGNEIRSQDIEKERLTQLTTENLQTTTIELQKENNSEKSEGTMKQNPDVRTARMQAPLSTEEAGVLDAALHVAVGRRDAATVTRLLADGAHPDTPDWEASGEPPLLRAAANGDIACVRALLAAGCEANARSALGETALHLAVRARTAISTGCGRESPGGIALGTTSALLLQELLAGGCDARLQCSLQGCSPLHALCRRGPWTPDDEEALRAVASVSGVVDLRDHRARTALHRLVEAGVSILSVYQILLGAGADASVQDARGETALVAALQRCGVGTAKVGPMSQVVGLLAPHTDLACATAYGETALHIAARTDRHSLLRLLLQEGAPAEARDLRGNTALHLATGRGFARAAAPLLAAAPAAVNAANAEGCTPLHVAVDSGFIDVVKILLEVKECNLHARTQLGQTPLDLAEEEYRRRSTPQMALILLQALNRQDTTASQ